MHDRTSTPAAPAGSRTQILVYFVLAYLISWAFWGSMIAFRLSAAPGRSTLGRVLYFAGIQGPFLAGLIVASRAGGVRRYFARLVIPPFHPGWLAAAVAAFPALYLAAAALAAWREGVRMPQPLVVSPAMGWGGLAAGQALIMFGEEYGWRGFALPRMEAHLGTLGASAVLGVLWAFWHLPLFFTAGSWQQGSIVAYAGFTTASCILQAMIFFRANRSVLAAMLYHGSLNASQFVLNVPDATSRYMPLMWAAGVAVAVLLMPRPLFRRGAPSVSCNR